MLSASLNETMALRRVGNNHTAYSPHQNIHLSALSNNVRSKLSGFFSTLTLSCWAPLRKAVHTAFKIFDRTREGTKPRPIDCEADAFTSSFELFVVSFTQEDVYIGHVALYIGHTLGLQVFS